MFEWLLNTQKFTFGFIPIRLHTLNILITQIERFLIFWLGFEHSKIHIFIVFYLYLLFFFSIDGVYVLRAVFQIFVDRWWDMRYYFFCSYWNFTRSTIKNSNHSDWAFFDCLNDFWTLKNSHFHNFLFMGCSWNYIQKISFLVHSP